MKKSDKFSHILYSTDYKGNGKFQYSIHKRLDLAEKALRIAQNSRQCKTKGNYFTLWIEENK